MGYAKNLSSAKLMRYKSLRDQADSSAKSIADLKKGGLDEVISDADHRKAIMNAAKRVVKVESFEALAHH